MVKSEFLSATLVYGDAASGKTKYLIEKAVELSAIVENRNGVCVVTNSPTASKALSLRLEAFAPDAAELVRVISARELCLEAIAFSGCARARRAMGAEWAFVLADMRAAGIGGVQARESLDRVLSRWRNGDFAGPGEELDRCVDEFLRRKLDEYHLLAPQEISALAAEVIQNGLSGRYEAVLVDDAQNLGSFTRRACALLASREVVFACDPEGAIFGFDDNPTPFVEGELADVCDAMRVVHLPSFSERVVGAPSGEMRGARINAFAHAVEHCDSSVYDELCESGAIDFDDKSVVLLKWGTPEDESEGIAKVVRGVIDRGEAEPGEIYVAVPNRTWGLSVRRSLVRRWVDVSLALDDEPVRGNPVRSETSLLYSAYAKVALLADAEDAMAWRIWCGEGAADLGVSAWRALEGWAEDERMPVVDALRRLAAIEEAPLNLELLASRAREGLLFVEQNRGLRGFSLFSVVFDGLPDDAFELDALVSGNEDASELASVIRLSASFRTFDFDPNHVCVGTYRGIVGMSPRVVVLMGAMDGFAPSRACFDDSFRLKETSVLREERRAFSYAASKARDVLVISTFQKADREMARKLGLVERRSRTECGVRVSMLSKSRFIDDAGNASPGTQGADWYMS